MLVDETALCVLFTASFLFSWLDLCGTATFWVGSNRVDEITGGDITG
jgi:hypothetical protein